MTIASLLGVSDQCLFLLFSLSTPVLYLFLKYSLVISFSTSIAAYLLLGGGSFLVLIWRTFGRDIRGAVLLLTITKSMKTYFKTNATIPKLFAEICEKHGQKVAIICEDQRWTFRDLDSYSNQVAAALSSKFRYGDVVAVYVDNRPEFVGCWLGLAKCGVTSALINFNLKSDPLAHCINVSKATGVIFSSQFTSELAAIRSKLSEKLELLCVDAAFDRKQLDAIALPSLFHSSPSVGTVTSPMSIQDPLVYIYTSGTTGLPKPAVITNYRFIFMAMGMYEALKIRSNDIFYDPLPLYHSAGGILGVGCMLLRGCTLIIRPKFSASKFWDDCVQHQCTVTIYIGEICRYLLSQPEKLSEKQHRIRLAFGNGMKAQFWREFQSRFGVAQIGEYYGATEGNANVVNTCNREGAVGFKSLITPRAYPVTLVKVDERTGEYVRDRFGLCVHAKAGEQGELVGKITKNPLRRFDGYVNKEATEKKIIRDVFDKGDTAFSTGDILEMDRDGFLYFRDRTGDTFRWQGENVSTSEVEGILSKMLRLQDVVVYGVEVPGCEGKAGMAAILTADISVDLNNLAQEMSSHLASYARPLFIRFLKELQTTSTFKFQKNDLKAEGFNIHATLDPIYFYDRAQNTFRRMTPDLHDQICRAKLRL